MSSNDRLNNSNKPNQKTKLLNEIKTGLVKRGLSISKLTLSAGSKIATHAITTVFADKQTKEKEWLEMLTVQAGMFTQELGELKGSLMKAGQMLSMYGEYYLPPEANQILKSLQSKSPPLNWIAIEKVLKTYWSPEQFAQVEIEQDAYASASIGQVHLGKLRSNKQKVAIKIQYPQLDKAIDSDLKALKTLLGLMKVLPKDFDIQPVFEEVRQMLIQEMDYELEAKTTIRVHKLTQTYPQYVVPQVIENLSNRNVLVTSFEIGYAPDSDTVKNLSQERRNKIAEEFLLLYFLELFEWGLMQTDPHLGNYRIQLSADGQDKLVCLDYGAAKSFDPSFLKPYHAMVACALHNDSPGLRKAAQDLKFLESEDDQELIRHFEEFCFTMVEPFIDYQDSRNSNGAIDVKGNYDWSKSDLPDRLSKIVWSMIKKFHLRSPPRDVLFLDRKTAGVFIFLKVLRANINGRKLLLPYLENLKK